MPPKPEQTTPEDNSGLTEKFKEIVRSNGIKDTVSEVIVKDAGLKGEGFASLTQYVTIKFENPQIKPLNLFVKAHTENPSHSAMLEELKAFEKEATFLVDYVTAAKEMCRRKGREGFIDFYPKCYYGDSKIIVQENLVLDKGYELINKEVRQDLEAAKFAIITLAKHHAIGHVMIEEIGGPKKFFEKFPNLDYEAFDTPYITAMMESSFDNSIKSNVNILEKSGVEGAANAATKLKSFLGKWTEILAESLHHQDDDSLFVLGHGDYWNNNMMFLRDKQTGRIVNHKAIDLQVTRYNSPGIDLAYYLFTSVQVNVRQRHLHELLKLYTDTFNSITNDLEHPTNLTYEKLFLDFRKKFGFGYWMGVTVANGPGMAVLKDVDISKVDIKDWADFVSSLIDQWISKNPDKICEIAEDIVKLVREQDELLLEHS